MKVRIIRRGPDGKTTHLFTAVFPEARTKKEARKLARQTFPLPTYTLGMAWKAAA